MIRNRDRAIIVARDEDERNDAPAQRVRKLEGGRVTQTDVERGAIQFQVRLCGSKSFGERGA